MPGSCRRASERRKQREAIARFFKFMAAHNFDWARTGHIPAFKAVLDDPRFKALPHRADIAPLASIGRPLPELRASAECDRRASSARKRLRRSPAKRPFRRRSRDAERRVDDLLAQVE